jgi:zinc protease
MSRMTVFPSTISARKATSAKARAKTSGKGSVKRLTLKNGLSVLLIENHKAPVVSVQMWVKTGSADERKGEEGISHFIEHLVFKGTSKYDVGAIASTVEASGGELNAYTSFDQTVFYVNISKAFSDAALDVISEMMGFPKFDASEIDNEREVVLEEIKRSNDSPGRQGSRLLFSTVYKDHPYGIPVIGYDRIIRKVSRKTLVDYYQSRYVPKNMHLVVAGDFDAKEMANKIEKNFGRIEPFKLRRVTRKKESKQTKPRIKVQQARFEEAQFHVAWKIPGADHKDIAALDVLALIIGQGDSSRLSQRLRMQAPVTNSVGAGTFTPKDSGIFTISGSLNVDQLEAAFTGLREELLKIVSEPPSAEELKKAIVNFESEEFYSMETIEGVARKAGSLENLMGDYAYFQKFLKQIYALKPEDLQKAARKYLGIESMNIVMMTPRNEKAITKYFQTWIRAYGKDFAEAKRTRNKAGRKIALKKVKWSIAKAASTSGAKIEKHVLKSGATVFFRESKETPVLNAKAAFLGGLRHEERGQTGLTELLSRTWTSGTKTLSETEILQKIENMAGGIGAFGGRNSAGISMQTISPFEKDALGLFDEILTAPVISEDAVEREKVIMLETIRSREDSPAQMVSQMFTETMFKGHPYERDLYGTRDTVMALTRDQVESHYRKMAMAKNLMVVVSGDVNRDKWLGDLETATALLPKGAPLASRFDHRGPEKSTRHFESLEREQTHIIIGYRGVTLTDPRRYTLQIVQSVLAGQGGRLFLELRDKASLAYSVSPMRMEGIETGYFGAYIGCSPQKGAKAIEMMQEEFRKLIDKPVPAAELERAKRYLIGRHDIDLQRNSAISASILFNEIYGIDSVEAFRYADKLKGITSDDVQALAREILTQPHVLCAVGPEQPW